jgi:hypothetical protein
MSETNPLKRNQTTEPNQKKYHKTQNAVKQTNNKFKQKQTKQLPQQNKQEK